MTSSKLWFSIVLSLALCTHSVVAADQASPDDQCLGQAVPDGQCLSQAVPQEQASVEMLSLMQKKASSSKMIAAANRTQCATEQLTNRATMQGNGWSFTSFTGTDALTGMQSCPSGSFNGYAGGSQVATASKTLTTAGTATLTYGNCWTNGQTKVYLNGAEIGSASSRTNAETVSFDITPSAVLSVKDATGNAVISMTSLQICESAAATPTPTPAPNPAAYTGRWLSNSQPCRHYPLRDKLTGSALANFRFNGPNNAYQNVCQVSGQSCSSNAWTAYAGGDQVGTASRTFNDVSAGHAILTYGNCWNEGKVKVYKDGTKIDEAGPSTPTKQLRFDIVWGTVLELKDEGGWHVGYNSVIQMSHLWICPAGAEVVYDD
jgi:hypothetical protein